MTKFEDWPLCLQGLVGDHMRSSGEFLSGSGRRKATAAGIGCWVVWLFVLVLPNSRAEMIRVNHRSRIVKTSQGALEHPCAVEICEERAADYSACLSPRLVYRGKGN
jgi:hypothetical protein